MGARFYSKFSGGGAIDNNGNELFPTKRIKFFSRSHPVEGGGGGLATYLFLGGYVCRMTQNCDPKPGQNFIRKTYKRGKVFPKKPHN